MSSPSRETEEPSSSTAPADEGPGAGAGDTDARPPAKRRLSPAVIEISDTDSDDSDVCAVNSYQASADEVKRIRGADYSSSSSSSDYSSDSESPWEDDSILVEDQKVTSKAVRAQLNPRANRMDDPLLNDKFKSQELKERLQSHWNEHKNLKTEEVTLTSEPFRLCLLHNFLANPDIINNIVDDMNTLDWSRKKMDLYEFHQTADLANLTWQRSIRGIYELLKTDVMSWVSELTGLTLQSVSASCSLYAGGDYLLAHDDLWEDRRVAFILYLAPWNIAKEHKENGGGDHSDCEEENKGWSRALGGSLQLFSTDAAGRPGAVRRAVCPQNNMFALFQVGKETFHQVEEVVSLELPRLSINGWFHGAPPPLPSAEAPPLSPEVPVPPPPPTMPLKPHTDPVVLPEWLDATYMSPRNRLQIQAQMERESEVSLPHVLLPDKLEALLEALNSPEVEWEACGPANQRHYSRVSACYVQSHSDSVVSALLSVFSSVPLLRALADCTDLPLSTYEGLELQRWGAQDYSLLQGREQYNTARLECLLYLCGRRCGNTTYVSAEEPSSEALVTVTPGHNELALVYCDAGAAGFTKYVSRLALDPNEHFYILSCTYRE